MKFKFWKLLQVFDEENVKSTHQGATTSCLYEMLGTAMTESKIPVENIVGLAADGYNTMLGKDYSGIFIQKYIFHSLNLRMSEACKQLSWLHT